MNIENTPFTVTDWNLAKSKEHKGTAGISFWKVCETGNIRVRMVDYAPGFRSDHFCPRGHVLLVLDGELEIEFKDGTTSTLTAGQSFQVSDDDINPHLAYSTKGARVFIVD